MKMKKALSLMLVFVMCVSLFANWPMPVFATETGETPVVEVTAEPSVETTVEPIVEPTMEPSVEPSVEPTIETTAEPTVKPTVDPIAEPTMEPTVETIMMFADPKGSVDETDACGIPLCKCEYQDPEEWVDHNDHSCARKSYVRYTYIKENTVEEIYAQWPDLDQYTKDAILLFLSWDNASKYEELKELISSPTPTPTPTPVPTPEPTPVPTPTPTVTPAPTPSPEDVQKAFEQLKTAQSRNEFVEIYENLSEEIKNQFTAEQLQKLEKIKNDLPSDFTNETEANGIKVNVNVKGDIPVDAKVTTTSIIGEELGKVGFNFEEHDFILTALDITIYDKDGKEWQPIEDKPITITFDVSGFGVEDGAVIDVHHKHGDKDPTVTACEVENGVVKFVTDGLSPVALADGYPLYPTSYNSSKLVYWDVAVPTGSSFPTHTRYTGSATRVKSVSFNNVSVAKGNSNGTSPSTWKISETAKSLSKYYPGTSLGSESNTQSLTIVPGDGYYVTNVTVACTASQPAKWNGLVVMNDAYNCGTWKSGNEYTQSLSYEKSGAVTIQIPSIAFCHMSNEVNVYIDNGGYIPQPGGENQYFILIEVAPIPSPLYVEYNYGDISFITNATDKNVFNNAASWLTPSSSNGPSGRYNIDTANTRFRYTSSGTEEEKAQQAASWTHYANSITTSADNVAAKYGYVFDGWEATYYTSCTNYNFLEQTQIGEETKYLEDEKVILHTHVKLTAKWKYNPSVLKGSLTVTKRVTGNIPSNLIPANFSITVSGNGYSQTKTVTKDGTVTFTDIPAGPVTITENTGRAAVSNYTLTVTGNNATVTISGGGTATATVTNNYTRQTGSLTVTKEVTGDILSYPDRIPAKFSITVTGPDGYTSTKEVAKDGTVTFTGIPTGQVTVTENVTAAQVTGYTLNVTGSGVQVNVANNAATAKVTNNYTRQTGTLVINKNVVMPAGFEFTENEVFGFTVEGPDSYSATHIITVNSNGEGIVEIPNLPTGDYTVTEVLTSAQQVLYTATYTPETPTVAVTSGGRATVAVTNTAKTGSITINKSVVMLAGLTPTAGETFEFTVTGPNGYSTTKTITVDEAGEGTVTINNLIPGNYTVTENLTEAQQPLYTATYTPETPTVEVTSGGNVAVNVTNTLKTGALRINKVVDKEYSKDTIPANDQFTFTVNIPGTDTTMAYNYSVYNTADDTVATGGTITDGGTLTLKGGQYAVIADLPLGNFIVTESADSDYRTKVNGTETYTATGAIVFTDTVEVTFENIYKRHLADLTIVKTGAAIDIDPNQSFIFKVEGMSGTETAGVNLEVVIEGNNQITVKDLPIGTYKVTEMSDWSWRYDIKKAEDITVSKGTALIIRNADNTPIGKQIEVDPTNNTITFKNTRTEVKWLDGNSWCQNLFNPTKKFADGSDVIERS